MPNGRKGINKGDPQIREGLANLTLDTGEVANIARKIRRKVHERKERREARRK
jgi:hypothetical protein